MGFAYHAPCLKCGSSDALAVYTDASQHCFSCGYNLNANGYEKIKALSGTQRKKGVTYKESNEIGVEAMQWLLKYELRPSEIDSFTWDEEKKHLIYRQAGFTNARCFDGDRKYMSYGEKPYNIIGQGSKVVLVEDIISCLKVARHTRSMCLFGSSVPIDVVPKDTEILVWLDPDKLKESLTLSKRLRDLGVKSCSIIATLDPKDYTDTDLLQFLS